MNYLLDTCLLSELHRVEPNPGVAEWVTQTDDARMYISVLSLGEIQKGIAKLDDGRRKRTIQAWLDDQLIRRFAGRIVPVDLDAALEWGLMSGAFARRGRPLAVIDSLLAVSAIAHNLTLVTRNLQDFADLPVKLVDPWT